MRIHGDEDQIAHSPARMAAPARAAQVENSAEPATLSLIQALRGAE